MGGGVAEAWDPKFWLGGHLAPPITGLCVRQFCEISVTRYRILGLKCTKFAFRWPADGAYSAPPGPLAVFKRTTSKGSEGEGEKKERYRGGKSRGG